MNRIGRDGQPSSLLCHRPGHSFSRDVLSHCGGAQSVARRLLGLVHGAVGEIQDAIHGHGVFGAKPRDANAEGKRMAGVVPAVEKSLARGSKYCRDWRSKENDFAPSCSLLTWGMVETSVLRFHFLGRRKNSCSSRTTKCTPVLMAKFCIMRLAPRFCAGA